HLDRLAATRHDIRLCSSYRRRPVSSTTRHTGAGRYPAGDGIATPEMEQSEALMIEGATVK
ncbi:MAG TPA: hypothetical protein VHA71_02680, partial [Rhodanobacteraceae bacterium]|nr:hypothetical protein [Rhodanobacteraceae bacterium]